MEKTQYLIIGGGIAGTSAAAAIRKNDKTGTITIISDESYPLYSRIVLSKASVLLKKAPLEKVFLKNAKWYEEQNINLKYEKAVHLDVKNKIVALEDKNEIQFEKLLLATGTASQMWDAPGSDKEGVFYLRTLDDAKKLIEKIPSIKSAVAIGSGFISFEVMDVLINAGVKVTEVMLEPYYWYPIFNKTAGELIEKALIKNGVIIEKNARVKKVLGKTNVEGVFLENERTIPCDTIICGIGTERDLSWLKNSGLLFERGIKADEFLQTNIPDIFTAGDAAEYNHPILNEPVKIGNWVNSQMQGMTAGHNMSSDQKKPYALITSYNSTGFETAVSFVGDVRPLPDRAIIPRGPEGNSYGQIIVKENRVVGAILINRGNEIAPLTKLITLKIDITSLKNKLSDASFDLKILL